MRFFIPRSCASWFLFSYVVGVTSGTQHEPNTIKDALAETSRGVADDGTSSASTSSEAYPGSPTIFNGMEVPPMKDLAGEAFDAETKDGYWFVKFFSPYCSHCKAIAPTWQTLYEFYYTSKPVADSTKLSNAQDSLNSFHHYYKFHFGSIDCVTWGDACNSRNITAFPTFSLYKDGTFIKKYEGSKDMEGLSSFIEEILESSRPGSRSKDGVNLPEPGAKSVDEDDSSKPSVPQEESVGREDLTAVSAPEENSAGSQEHVSTKSKGKAKSLPPGPRKSTVTPNIKGISIDLSQESFQKLVTNTQDPWFVKFYAPWCHHCQALAPIWLEMAKELRGELNVGEVNCEVEVRLCKDVRVKAYPTLLFFRGGERVEYDGLRGLGDLINYAKKALDVGGGVAYVDAAAFKALEETEEVIFLYFYDHATTHEDFEALERLTLSLIGHAKLVKTDSALLADRFKISTWPRLLVSRDGRPSYYTALAPREMRDFRQVLNWMQSVWLPIVPELTASNSQEIMRGKFVVLGVLSREDDEFASAKREIKNAALEWMEKQTHAFQLERQELRDAKQLRLEEAEDRGDQRALRVAKSIQIDIREDDKKQVGFAWVDGVFWERWLRTTYGVAVREGQRVIINDEDNGRYWDLTETGAFIVPSRTSILETLPKVVVHPPKLPSKSSSGAIQQAFFQARSGASSHPFLSLVVLIGIGVTAMWAKGRMRNTRGGGGFFQLDGKEGFLNGGGYGKAD